jgi:hypothetical protein
MARQHDVIGTTPPVGRPSIVESESLSPSVITGDRARRAGARSGHAHPLGTLPFQAYDAFDDAGVLDAVRARGRDIPPLANGRPVALAVARQVVLDLLARASTSSTSSR